jgi:predicted RNA-binding protein Jag
MDEYNINRIMKSGYTYEQAMGRAFAKIIGEDIWEAATGDALIDEIGERIPKFAKDIECYGITDVTYDKKDGYVIIKTYRPGVVIGVKGKYVGHLEELFKNFAKKEGLKFSQIKIKEDTCPIKDDLMHPLFAYQQIMEDY